VTPAPVIVCDLPDGALFTCDEAVEAALSVVPTSHPAITTVTVREGLYGVAFPLGASGFYSQAGYVLFSVETGSGPIDMYVQVGRNKAGNVSASGPWRSFPCCERPSASPA